MLRSRLLVGFLASVAALAGTAHAQEDPAQELEAARRRIAAVQDDVVKTLDRVRRSSVSVRVKVYPKTPPGQPAPPVTPEPMIAGCGSGVIVRLPNSSRPWVITNHHVIEGGEVITVVDLDGTEHPVEVHDTVAQYDIALLSFTARPQGLDGVKILQSRSKDLEEGQWVLATGNPFFLADDGGSVATLGVVSGLDRVLGGRFLYGSAIQHDAAVNPGNSGGPLWNLAGDLIGINGMIIVREREGGPTNSGASFSIPVHQIVPFLKSLKDERTDARSGWLGLMFETATDSKGKPNGAKVMKILGGCPCYRDVREGDVLVQFSAAGKLARIRTASDIINALVMHPAGREVSLVLRRGNRSVKWKGKLGSGG